ncbi:MAG: hypothetical protein AAB421_03215 [Patescibacteria group bacterium]
MLSNEELAQILHAAVQAPSGHNAQPWDFGWDGMTLFVRAVYGKDRSVFNYLERGTVLAVGGVVESIGIFAPTIGFKSSVRYVYDPRRGPTIAEITFSPTTPEKNSARVDALFARTTNRKQYAKKEVAEDIKDHLQQAALFAGHTELVFIDSPVQMKLVARASTQMETFMLKVPALREAMFTHVVWDDAEEARVREGMFVKTLELTPPAFAAFKAFTHMPFVATLAGFLGMGSRIAAENAMRYASAGACGLIAISDMTERTLFELGRSLLRVWITATEHGLALQPIGGVIFLAARAREEVPSLFSQKIAQSFIVADDSLGALFKIPDGMRPGLLFRCGYADAPSARSSKKSPIVEYAKRGTLS